MSRKGKRKRVAEGVYEDQNGLAATKKVSRKNAVTGALMEKQREQRFERGTSLEFIARWRESAGEAMLEELEKAEAGEPLPAPGTFAEDLARYEHTLEGRVGGESDRSHLHAWLPLIGTKPRRKIRSAHVKAAIRSWQGLELAARTIRHR